MQENLFSSTLPGIKGLSKVFFSVPNFSLNAIGRKLALMTLQGVEEEEALVWLCLSVESNKNNNTCFALLQTLHLLRLKLQLNLYI